MSGLRKPFPALAVSAILAKRSPNNRKVPVSLPSSSVVVPYSHCNAFPEKEKDNDAMPVGYMNLYVSLSIKLCLYKRDVSVV